MSLAGIPEIDRIEAVLERLPLLDVSSSGVRPHAESIYLAYLIQCVRKGNPHRQRAGTNKAVTHLTKLGELLTKVHTAIKELPDEAIAALMREALKNREATKELEFIWHSGAIGRVPMPQIVAIDAKGMAKLVEAAREKLLSDPNPTIRKKPENKVAEAVARMAADAYEALTQKRAIVSTINNRASGDYFCLVSELFAILPTGGKPEMYAREVAGQRRKSNKEKRTIARTS
jgi:hypothetical protein